MMNTSVENVSDISTTPKSSISMWTSVPNDCVALKKSVGSFYGKLDFLMYLFQKIPVGLPGTALELNAAKPLPIDLNPSSSTRPSQPRNIQSEGLPTQVQMRPDPSSTSTHIPSPYSGANTDTLNAPLPYIPPVLQLMECRIDSLEKRLPSVEDSLRVVLRLVEPILYHASTTPSVSAPVTTSFRKPSQPAPIHTSFSPCDEGNHYSIGLDSGISSSNVSPTSNIASSCPPLGSSKSNSPQSSTPSPIHSSANSQLFRSPLFIHDESRKDFGGTTSNPVPNHDLVALADEHNNYLLNDEVPPLPDIDLSQFWESTI